MSNKPLIPPHKILQTAMKISDIVHYQLTIQELQNICYQYKQGDTSDSLHVDFETGELYNATTPICYLVRDHITEHRMLSEDYEKLEHSAFDNIFSQITVYLDELKDLWVTDCFAFTENHQRLALRVTSDKPWTNLFMAHRFQRPSEEELDNFHPEWQILCANDISLKPEAEFFSEEPCIVISFQNRLLLIAGEINSVEIINAVKFITDCLEKKM